MSYDKDKAIGYILEHGNVLDTYKMEFMLGLGRDDRVPLDFFISHQNEDGGFAFKMEKGNPSSVATTLSMLEWYNELEITYTGSYKRCVRFLLDHQEGGAWDEPDDIATLNPEEWYVPHALSTKLWLTAQTANDLLFYEKEEYAAQKSLRFMHQHKRDDGTFEGYTITNWIMMSLYAQLGMSEAAQALLPYVRMNIEKDTKLIIWALDCLWKAKMENVLAGELLDLLESKQARDGCWTTAEGEECYPLITVEALRTLKRWERT